MSCDVCGIMPNVSARSTVALLSLLVVACTASPVAAPATTAPAAARSAAPPPTKSAVATTGPAIPSPFTVTDIDQKLDGDAADPTAVVLPDGRVRVYVAGVGPGSYISADGVRFTPEPGERVDRKIAGPHKRVFRLPDGRWRMFFNTLPQAATKGIGSAIGSDGLTFMVEPGLRITVADAGVSPHPDLSVGDVVPMPDGRYRMYFSSFTLGDRRPDTTGDPNEFVKSAVSSDLFTWAVEPGVRIGPGAQRLTGSAEHPAALLNSDGSVSLFYGRLKYADPPRPGLHPESGLYVATSRDGLTFDTEARLLNSGGLFDVDARGNGGVRKVGDFGQLSLPVDSAVIRLGDGTILLYHSDRRDLPLPALNMVKIKRLTAASR